jgi:hypothetical protein
MENIKVGDGATMNVGSDCYPYTVVEVSPSGKTIKIQMDNYRGVGGTYPDIKFEYTKNPNGPISECKFSKKFNRWKANGHTVHFGSRRYYQDPHI